MQMQYSYRAIELSSYRAIELSTKSFMNHGRELWEM